jgi:hypothetical protein
MVKWLFMFDCVTKISQAIMYNTFQRLVYIIKVSVIEVSLQTLCWKNIKVTAIFARSRNFLRG